MDENLSRMCSGIHFHPIVCRSSSSADLEALVSCLNQCFSCDREAEPVHSGWGPLALRLQGSTDRWIPLSSLRDHETQHIRAAVEHGIMLQLGDVLLRPACLAALLPLLAAHSHTMLMPDEKSTLTALAPRATLRRVPISETEIFCRNAKQLAYVLKTMAQARLRELHARPVSPAWCQHVLYERATLQEFLEIFDATVSIWVVLFISFPVYSSKYCQETFGPIRALIFSLFRM